jgi:hypothetical protein
MDTTLVAHVVGWRSALVALERAQPTTLREMLDSPPLDASESPAAMEPATRAEA